MRRMILSMVALSLLGALSGCGYYFAPREYSHGICDCDVGDHCSSRSPWIRTTTAAPAEAIPAPAKELPSGPKGL